LTLPRESEAPLILVVDDFDDNRTMFAEYLGFKGFRTAVAKSGAEALERARIEPPALVVMDLGMPEIDGCETARRLRAREKTRRVPIIALTGQTDAHSRREALSAGCDVYLTKPCSPQELLSEIRRLLAPPPGDQSV
jgi:two-component system, cell cycle response regulator DivK